MRRIVRSLALAALLVAGAPLIAADSDSEAEEAKTAIAYFEKYSAGAKDDQKYSGLVMDLAQVRHTLCADRVGKILLKDNDEEHKLIAASAMEFFGEKAPLQEHGKDGGWVLPADPSLAKRCVVRNAAGAHLVKALQKDFSQDVNLGVVDTIGKIRYRDAIPELNQNALKGGDPYVLLAIVRAMGRLQDRCALPVLLELWERNPKGYSWETEDVSVDTGAAGTADQEAAEAEWHRKNDGKMKGKKKPPVMLKQYMQELARTIHILTGEKFERPEELRKWMEMNSAELAKEGIKVPEFRGVRLPPKKDKDGKGKESKDGEGK